MAEELSTKKGAADTSGEDLAAVINSTSPHPTTAGFGDSKRALNYYEPHND